MIKNMLVIGDSHTGYLIDKKVEHDLFFQDGVHILTYSGRPCYSFEYANGGSKFEEVYALIDDSWVILPFFGEVDIRIHLVEHDNPELLAKTYVEKTLNFFETKKCKIHFIEPVPQSNVIMEGSEFAYTYFDYDMIPWGRKGTIEERMAMQNRFVKSLREECSKNNLDAPVCVSYNITKTDELMKEESMDGSHLSKELSNKLFLHLKSLYNI